MNDWKVILGVAGGSLLLLILAVVGFGKLAQSPEEIQVDESVYQQVEENIRNEVVRGEARVTVVEFSDFQCPACRSAEPISEQLREMDGVRFVYKHFPLRTIHKNAQRAAEAAEVARGEGKFWEMHDKLFETQDDWEGLGNPNNKFSEYAAELGMDAEAFKEKLSGGEGTDAVNGEYQEGVRLGVNATPTFFVNGEKVAISDVISTVNNLLSTSEE